MNSQIKTSEQIAKLLDEGYDYFRVGKGEESGFTGCVAISEDGNRERKQRITTRLAKRISHNVTTEAKTIQCYSLIQYGIQPKLCYWMRLTDVVAYFNRLDRTATIDEIIKDLDDEKYYQ